MDAAAEVEMLTEADEETATVVDADADSEDATLETCAVVTDAVLVIRVDAADALEAVADEADSEDWARTPRPKRPARRTTEERIVVVLLGGERAAIVKDSRPSL